MPAVGPAARRGNRWSSRRHRRGTRRARSRARRCAPRVRRTDTLIATPRSTSTATVRSSLMPVRARAPRRAIATRASVASSTPVLELTVACMRWGGGGRTKRAAWLLHRTLPRSDRSEEPTRAHPRKRGCARTAASVGAWPLKHPTRHESVLDPAIVDQLRALAHAGTPVCSTSCRRPSRATRPGGCRPCATRSPPAMPTRWRSTCTP